ncbi:DNA repair protein XRCC1 isoform X3 [Choloepus didactylus]|uniref:DNA repair protein XRCC1 isoform X3 n=1 Tax=Choloepus didactylus TaxID=27675 RepID=UPI0018A024C6|nr:DNA repair protein XRCC1 isoform X3 [Choloepus didactylus]
MERIREGPFRHENDKEPSGPVSGKVWSPENMEDVRDSEARAEFLGLLSAGGCPGPLPSSPTSRRSWMSRSALMLSGCPPPPTQVLLVTSSFMSPTESRSGSNPNRVRIFGPDKLVRAAAEKRWDRVKIVCSQPYSKDAPYGLSFVRFHSPPDKDEAPPESSSQKVTKLGQFRVKEEDESGNCLRPGALFFSRVNKTSPATASDQAGPSYAAATLQASGAASSSPLASRAVGSASKPQEKGKRKLDLNQEEQKTLSKPSAQLSPPTLKRPKLPAPSRTPTPTPAPPPAQGAVPGKPQGEGTKPRGPRAGPQELGKILQGVVVVLSGFQNPFRSELRDKVLELGAKYRPDWTPDSTHLICAFANTPKYSQVLGLGGRIVRKEWVLDCHRMRRRLPSRRYLMAGPGSSSEDEGGLHSSSSGDEAPKTPRKRPPSKTKLPQAAGPSPPQKPPTPEGAPEASSEPQDGTPTEGEQSEEQENGAEDSGDTEDELRRVAEQKEQRQPAGQGENGEDPYAGSTDENTDSEDGPESPSLPVPELPDFFQGKHFFLYGEFPGDERRQLIRYVTAFNGELEDYMSDRVQFVITAQEWDPSFEEVDLQLQREAEVTSPPAVWGSAPGLKYVHTHTCTHRMSLIKVTWFGTAVPSHCGISQNFSLMLDFCFPSGVQVSGIP